MNDNLNDSGEKRTEQSVKINENQSDLSPPSKKIKKNESSNFLNFHSAYNNKEFIDTLYELFYTKEEKVFENGARIEATPFTCCVLPNFITPDDSVEKLKTAVSEMDVWLKANDLFHFKQSDDLSSSSVPEIQALKNFFYTDVLEWMRKVTKIPLTDKVDISCSCYTYADHLLCHDDELEGRRIAYIYYLASDWEKEYGGSLDLFDTVNGQPSEIVTSFTPVQNQLIFFEVGPTSFHQVAEILSFKTRISISGWFYGPPLEPTTHEELSLLFTSPSTISVDVKEWINPTYLQINTQTSIRESFEESSEIELMDFIQGEKYEELSKALNGKDVKWSKCGPPNRRKYEELSNGDDTPAIIADFQTLFRSDAFLQLLANLTGLHLHPSCGEGAQMAELNSSMRKWSAGSYTLLHNKAYSDGASLNAALAFNCADWDNECGGYTSYVVEDDDVPLLRVEPRPNSLALVYITEGTANFVKYINCRVLDRDFPWFQDIFTMYKEKQ